MKKRARFTAITVLFTCWGISAHAQSSFMHIESSTIVRSSGNPVITNLFTADPAGLVYNDTLFIYTGHDEQVAGVDGYVMRNWYVFSTTNMVDWTNHGSCLSLNTFSWAVAHAWAGQCIERDGRFYWYVPVYYNEIESKKGFAIGVAVSDSPTGPFTDALGYPLITNDMTTDITIDWDNIDPTVFIDVNNQAYLYFGNTSCKYVKLKNNMIQLDGEIQYISLPGFTEAPYIHKKDDTYYLSYAYGWPEKIAYATSDNITGPWTYQGIINDLVDNCTTNHQSILEYKGKWYFIYHNGALPTGGNFRRSVCIDTLGYDDECIEEVEQTDEGVSEILPASVNQASLPDNRICIFPNPVSGNTINIKVSNGIQMDEIVIIDIMGKVVFSRVNVKDNELSIRPDICKGSYIMQVLTGNTVYCSQFIVL